MLEQVPGIMQSLAAILSSANTIFFSLHHKAIVAVPQNNLSQGAVEMMPLSPESTLISRIGPQSVHFFTALSIGVNWLDEPVTTWPEIPIFKKLFTFAHSLPVSNESTERMIKRTNDYRNYGGKKEVDFQATLQMVGADIEAVPRRNTKKAYGQ